MQSDMIFQIALHHFILTPLPEGDLGFGFGPQIGFMTENFFHGIEIDGEFADGNPIRDAAGQYRMHAFFCRHRYQPACIAVSYIASTFSVGELSWISCVGAKA